MFLTVNTELLTMLMTSLARDADALGSIKVEVEVQDLPGHHTTHSIAVPRLIVMP